MSFRWEGRKNFGALHAPFLFMTLILPPPSPRFFLDPPLALCFQQGEKCIFKGFNDLIISINLSLYEVGKGFVIYKLIYFLRRIYGLKYQQFQYLSQVFKNHFFWIWDSRSTVLFLVNIIIGLSKGKATFACSLRTRTKNLRSWGFFLPFCCSKSANDQTQNFQLYESFAR